MVWSKLCNCTSGDGPVQVFSKEVGGGGGGGGGEGMRDNYFGHLLTH